jgi:cation diffusion facilitator family transporter
MRERTLRRLVLLSVVAASLTLGLKFLAYWLTGSVGLLSDAAESVVNLLAAAGAYVAVRYAALPVDATHTYGHEKIEYFSSGLEGVLILVAAVGIAWYAVQRLVVPEELHDLGVGVGVGAVTAAVNLVVARLLLRAGKAHGSIVLEADGRHLMTDVWTTAGVLAGLALVWLTGHVWLDPVIALVVAANIVRTAVDLVWRSFNGLMDHALPEAEQAKVRSAIQSRLAPGLAFHALRTRQAGSRRFADFHLLVPGEWTVRQAHELIDRIEEAVTAALPGIEVTVHVEPIEERASWEDSALLALEEAQRLQKGSP